jgi:hypothetical protein
MEAGNAQPEKIRKRIEIEDSLLNSRSTIFLVINGIWLSAISLKKDLDAFQIIIPVCGIIISIMWFLCSIQSTRIIAALNRKYLEVNQDDSLEKFIDGKLFSRTFLRPSELIGQWLPLLFIIIWAVILFLFA